MYALEGSVFIGGAVVQWLRDGLGLIRQSSDVEALAVSVPDNGGVYLVPAFAGLGAPHWDPYARGDDRRHHAGHDRRARRARGRWKASRSRSPTCWRHVGGDAGIALAELRVDGGAAANDALLQFQADLLGVPVVRPEVTETTALGAAYLAGLAVGFWDSTEALAQHWRADKRFEPSMPPAQAAARRAEWREALNRSKSGISAGAVSHAPVGHARARSTRGAIPGTSWSSAAAPPAWASPSMRPAAGYDVLLLEQHDFGKGTSSRSTKLVHGGVRYLEQGNISLVMEALKERGLLRQNAPHLVQRSRLRRAQLRLVGGAVLRSRPQGLQRAGRQVRLRALARSSRARRRSRGCRPSRPKACGAASSTTTASSTTRGCSSIGGRPRPSRARPCSTTRRSSASRRPPTGFVDGVVATRSGNRPAVDHRARRVVVNATGAVLRRGAAAGRPRAQRR